MVSILIGVFAKLLDLFPFVKKSHDKHETAEVNDEFREAVASDDVVRVNELLDDIMRDEKRPTDFTK